MPRAALRSLAPFALAAAAAGAAAGTSACASGGRGRAARPPRVYVDTEVVQVQVQSSYLGSLDLYVVSEGVASRLGEVNTTRPETFVIEPTRFDLNDLAVVAVPVGGYGRASTGRLTVRRGNIVQFTIPPNLRPAGVIIR